MNIRNFEQRINRTILDRGYDYYIDGNVIKMSKIGDNEYHFHVKGKEIYEVIINLDKSGEILFSECDCPYDFGPICKHEVAAYFELFEILNSCEDNEVVNNPEIETVLEALPKEELIKIILDLVNKDLTLENSLMVKYSKGDKNHELEKCKQLIDLIVHKYQGRDHFISYRQTADFTYELEEVLDKVRNTDDVLIALDIAFLLLNESIEAIQYADDSSGDIGLFISEIFNEIEKRLNEASDLSYDLKEKIFNKLLKESENNAFDDWNDYRHDLLRLCLPFVDNEDLRNKFISKLEALLSPNSDDYSNRYNNEQILNIIYEIIVKYGTKEEANSFLHQYIHFSSFRELLIDKYMSEENYQKVIELTIDGEKQDEDYLGLVHQWQKLKYVAYKKLNMKEKQETLAKELLLNGDFEYYYELKELVIGDKTEFYQNLKQELKNNKDWHINRIYLDLILAENDLDELLEYVNENPRSIEKYVDLLKGKFPNEVIRIYKQYIHMSANTSSNRKQYKGVCRILKNYKKIVGENLQKELINELMNLYKRRPAFIDELSNLNEV